MSTLPPKSAGSLEELTSAVQDAEIVARETREEDKRFTVYKIVLNNARQQKFVLYHRYSDFKKLHDTLKDVYGKEPTFPKFPGKKLLGDNFDPAFLQARQTGLQEFIQTVLQHPHYSTHPAVKQFLLDSLTPRRGHSRNLSDEGLDTEGGASSEGGPHVDLGDTENKKAAIQDFSLLKVIGKGSFGKVLLGMHKETRVVYAIKVLNKDAIIKQNEVKHIMSERNVLKGNVKHPFLVGLHYSFQTSKKLYFVLDYVNGGEVFFHLQRDKRFAPPRARFYAAEITSALGYLHSLNIVYRDLKPENLLLDSEGHIKLTDFGLCKENLLPGKTTATFCGTPEYLAPEVLKKQPYGRPVDWWCLGCVTYEMMCGLPPFYSRDCNEMYERILKDPLKFPEHVPAVAQEWLRGLLERVPDQRLGSGPKDAADVMAHPFFSGLDWDALNRREIKPPFNPKVENEFDLRNIDPEFVNEPVPQSVIASRPAGAGSPDEVTLRVDMPGMFEGFTFSGENSLATK